MLFKPSVVAVALIVGAIMLLWAEKRLKTVKVDSESLITYKQAFIVGAFQCMALIPGCSRSGSTLTAGLFMGLERAAAARFSFLLEFKIKGFVPTTSSKTKPVDSLNFEFTYSILPLLSVI